MTIKAIQHLIAAELASVERLITESTRSQVDLTEVIGNYVIKSGGKRIRATLAVLSACALGYEGQDHLLLAAIIEIIHTATLLHDDVVDASSMRRNQPSANAIYGNMASVLCGDYLYSKAFQLMIQLGRLNILEILANTSNTLAQGEMLQLQSCYHPELDEATYYAIIRQKTAGLFEAACKIPTALQDSFKPFETVLQSYGNFLGLAFQIIDDALDYSSDAATMGKNPGDDLSEGKMTLPLIYTLAQSTVDEKALIVEAVKNGDRSQFENIKHLIDKHQALDYTYAKARAFAAQSKEALAPLPDSPYKTALLQLADLSVQRNH